jgi:hypothetical protein
MQETKIQLKDGRSAVIREASPDDALRLLRYLDEVTAETDFLSMGPGDFNWPEEKERQFIEDHRQPTTNCCSSLRSTGRSSASWATWARIAPVCAIRASSAS